MTRCINKSHWKLFLLSILFLGNGPAFADSKVRVLREPEFSFSQKASAIQSPLKFLLKPDPKDWYLGFDFEIQVAKNFESIRDEDFSNHKMIQAIAGVHSIEKITNSPDLAWNVTKTAKKLGVALDVQMRISQILVRGERENSENTLKNWMIQKHQQSIVIPNGPDEIVVMQKLSHFDRIFSEGVSVLHIRRINADLVAIKMRSLIVLKSESYSKLQVATFFKTRQTFESALREQFESALTTLPQIW